MTLVAGTELETQSTGKVLDPIRPKTLVGSTRNYGLLDTAEKVEILVDRVIKAGTAIGFDIETGYDGKDEEKVALKPFHPNFKVVGFSFTNSEQWARYVSIAHDNAENVDTVRTARALWRLVNSGLGVAHNAHFELQGLSRWFRETLWDDPEVGAEVRESEGYFQVLSDSMLEAWMLAIYPPLAMGGGVGTGLKNLTKFVFGHDQAEIESLFPEVPKTKMKYLRFNSRELTTEVVAYACEDAVWCLALHNKHYPLIKDELMFKTEILLTPVLARMEREGLALDWDEYQARSADTGEFKDRLNEQIQNELSRRLGTVVNANLGSPKQVSDLLFNQLGLKPKSFTDTGAASTGEAALRALAAKDPAIKQILQWREVGKLKGTYIDKYLKELNYAEDGRAHPNHKQHGALTGRLSVDGVSYQQWPKPYHYELDDGSTYDLNYRDFLISPPNSRIIGYDFSQVELRILAGMANETALLKAFADGTDIHSATASTMMGIPLELITKEDRAKGKTLNFAVVYGSGAENIGELLGISKEEAQELLDKYFEAFPGLKGWMDKKVQEGLRDGFVHTKFGRKFTVWEYQADERWIRSKGDRMCVNAPVQGGAADYMKLGMVRVDRAIRKAEKEGKIPKGSIRLIMTVHDALEFYVRNDVTTQTAIDIISPAVSFPVAGLPEIRADWHEGHKWGSVIEIILDDNKKIAGWEVKKELHASFEEANAHQERLKEEARLAAAAKKEERARTDALEASEPQLSVETSGEQLAIEPLEHGDYGTYPGEEDLDPANWTDYGTRKEDDGEGDHDPDDVPMALAPDVVEAEIVPEPEILVDEPEWAHATIVPAVTILLTLRDMPNPAPWKQFQLFMAEHPGADTIIVVTPEGDLELETKHSITPDDANMISHMLGGVKFSRQ